MDPISLFLTITGLCIAVIFGFWQVRLTYRQLQNKKKRNCIEETNIFNKPIENIVNRVQKNDIKFSKSLLTFDITIYNPSNKPKHIIKVGVQSKVTGGSFNCLSGSETLIPLADYPISFHVKNRETIIPADPIIVIKPGDSIRFTISLIPDATGACGYWSASVKAIVIFDDGTIVETIEEPISESDLRNYQNRHPDDNEIIQGLRHRIPSLRIKALHQLPSSGINKETIKTLLEAKLQDEIYSVKREAARIAVKFNLMSLSQLIIDNLQEMLDKIGLNDKNLEIGI
jgi:hypothetical protein